MNHPVNTKFTPHSGLCSLHIPSTSTQTAGPHRTTPGDTSQTTSTPRRGHNKQILETPLEQIAKTTLDPLKPHTVTNNHIQIAAESPPQRHFISTEATRITQHSNDMDQPNQQPPTPTQPSIHGVPSSNSSQTAILPHITTATPIKSPTCACRR